MRQKAATGTFLAVVFLGFPAAAQLEAPTPSLPAPSVAPSLTPPPGPAIGGTLTGPSQPGGFFGQGGQGAILAPDSRTRLGTVGFPFNAVGGQGEVAGQPTRGWSLTPSLSLEQSYNDNIRFSTTNRQDDFITTVRPGILLGVDTVRLQGTLNYAPGILYYWNTSDQNRIDHNGNAQFLGIVVPDFFFIDARGSAAVQSLSGGFTPDSEASVGRENQVQTTTFSLSPYLTHRFGGLASARVGYVYSYVNQDRADPDAPLPDDTQLQSSFTPSEYSSHQGYVVVRSGEDWGRVAMQGTLSTTQFEGSGLYDGAYRDIALTETRYAFTPTVAGLVELGWERQRFNTVPKTDIDDLVWAFGVRLTPTPESVIVAKYGHRDGFNSFYLDGTLAVGVRTRIFARYAEQLTSSALTAGDLLGTTTLDPLGNPVDAQTGAPVLPGFANSTLGIQSGLSRQKVATASISQTWTRDTFRLSLSQTDTTPVANAPGQTPGFASKGTNLGLSWSRDLAPTTTLISFANYGITTSGPQDTEGTTWGAGASLVQELRPGLSGALTYRFNYRDGGVTRTGNPNAGEATQNIITAGLRQSF
ncbi:TIGR03016 family PEP-CTERM system-associated outer membrane protein [Elioraea sp.]|uniref:TIGR03016 family PEP-CTERM system-associated outer membrane protein n=1 Tax=Elioraea sp. TaxID=2185103 RepID=UPI0025C3A3C6|nr:TIGR03016 family PEP-CTERM system-associated outer membrane protein [Elioraea sp.]